MYWPILDRRLMFGALLMASAICSAETAGLFAQTARPGKADEPQQSNDDDVTPQLAAEIRRHIRELDADGFEARENASRQLWLIGPRTIPFLEDAAKSGSPEVRFRADALLHSIQRGPLKMGIETYCAQAEETL